MTKDVHNLSERIRKMDFVAAMREISCLYSDLPKHGTALRVKEESVRLSQRASLAFRGSALDELTEAHGKHPHRLFVNFQGLFGTNGPLPTHYTEYANRRQRHDRDATFYEFIDIFNHRLLSLFYRAIADFDPSINLDRQDTNNFDVLIGSLGGVGLEASRTRDSIPDYAKFFHSGWMGGAIKNPDGLISLVENYFQLPAAVKEFVGGWLPLPPGSRNQLGSKTGGFQLGTSSYIGSKIWSIGHKFQLSVGPLTWAEYLSFRPGGARAAELYDLVRNYLGDEWDWDLELLLEEGEVAPMALNRKSSLGFTCWLASDRTEKLSMQNVTLNRRVISSVKH